MNQHLSKFLKAGIFAGISAMMIEIIISATVTEYLGQNIDAVALVLGGATVGLITLALTVIISSVIVRGIQKI